MFSVTDEEYIAVEIKLDASHTTYEVSEFNAGHLWPTTAVIRDKQIICRQIDAFDQSAGAEHCCDFSAFEQLFNPQTNRRWQISNVVCHTLSNKLCQIIVSMDLSFYIICQISQFFIVNLWKPFCILPSSVNCRVFTTEICNIPPFFLQRLIYIKSCHDAHEAHRRHVWITILTHKYGVLGVIVENSD